MIAMASSISIIITAVMAGVAGFGLIAFFTSLIILIRTHMRHKNLLIDLENQGIPIPNKSTNISKSKSKSLRPQRVVLRRKSARFSFGRLSPPKRIPGWITLESTENIHSDMAMAAHQPPFTVPPTYGPASESWMRRDCQSSDASDSARWPLATNGDFEGLSNSPSPPSVIDERYSNKGLHLGVLPSVDAVEHYNPVPRFGNHAHIKSDSEELLRPPPLFSSNREDDPEGLQQNRKRSQTVANTGREYQNVFDIPNRPPPVAVRPELNRARSFCLEIQPPSMTPAGPLPPLPHSATVPKHDWPEVAQNDRSQSNQSLMSVESIGSSLLIATPKSVYGRKARVRGGAGKDWKKSVVIGSNRVRKPTFVNERPYSWNGQKSQGSIKTLQSLEGRISCMSSGGQNSEDTSQSALILVNDRVSELMRESLQGSHSSSNLKMDSDFGRPTESSSSTQPISGSSPAYSPRSTMVSSCRSSNGNPFQWDLSLVHAAATKPSALKGSPTSRKNLQKRAQCVRISVPAKSSSRPQSPLTTFMFNASEVLESIDSANPSLKDRHRSLPIPPSSSIFNPDIKLNVLHGSLTPVSPELSLVNLNIDNSNGFNVVGFDDNKFQSPSRMSTPSIFSIPRFPSPVKAITTTSPAQTFAFSDPATNNEDSSHIFDLSNDVHYLPRPNLVSFDLRNPLKEEAEKKKDPNYSSTKSGAESSHQDVFVLPFKTTKKSSASSSGHTHFDSFAPQFDQSVSSTSSSTQSLLPTKATVKTDETITNIITASQNNTISSNLKPPNDSPIRASIQALRRMNSEALLLHPPTPPADPISTNSSVFSISKTSPGLESLAQMRYLAMEPRSSTPTPKRTGRTDRLRSVGLHLSYDDDSKSNGNDLAESRGLGLMGLPREQSMKDMQRAVDGILSLGNSDDLDDLDDSEDQIGGVQTDKLEPVINYSDNTPPNSTQKLPMSIPGLIPFTFTPPVRPGYHSGSTGSNIFYDTSPSYDEIPSPVVSVWEDKQILASPLAETDSGSIVPPLSPLSHLWSLDTGNIPGKAVKSTQPEAAEAIFHQKGNSEIENWDPLFDSKAFQTPKAGVKVNVIPPSGERSPVIFGLAGMSPYDAKGFLREAF